MIVLRSDSEIDLIRRAGEIVASVLGKLKNSVRPGIETRELDAIARDEILKKDGYPAFKNYKGFPGNICTSLNEVVVHGIPSERRLANGDIVSIDVGVRFKDYFADGAATYGVGEINEEKLKLLKVTSDALYLAIALARPDRRLSDISHGIQEFVESEGFSVVRAFVGHGIGTELHEEPEIPNYGKPNSGSRTGWSWRSSRWLTWAPSELRY